MLCILKPIIIGITLFVIIQISSAKASDTAKDINLIESNPDLEWAKAIGARHQAQSMQNLKDMMRMQGFDQNLQESILKPRPVLQIFVSSSMPKHLLKAYGREASRYGGVLVFNGLPRGSFCKITDLVMDISDKDYPCAMQIDDEAFKAFGIKYVPSIVLSKPVSMFEHQSTKSRFDKVLGNISIKSALELFSNSGELAALAREVLAR